MAGEDEERQQRSAAVPLADLPEVRMPRLNLVRRDLADRTVISLAGEIDLESVPLLREAFAQCTREGVRTVDVDLIAVTFCDFSGLRAFLEMSRRAAKAGGTLRLHHPSTALARILDLTGTASLLLGPPAVPAPDASLQPTAGPLPPLPRPPMTSRRSPYRRCPRCRGVRGGTPARHAPRQRPCSRHLPVSRTADNRRSRCTCCSSRS
ncbi:STAS domain-containing protein [Streptomyces sp. 184]|uniref:STAS domain-containing protein n=1 Tax=Streptomyces sp. 184 TaxID=1827526 RepID=UPI0038918143